MCQQLLETLEDFSLVFCSGLRACMHTVEDVYKCHLSSSNGKFAIFRYFGTFAHYPGYVLLIIVIQRNITENSEF